MTHIDTEQETKRADSLSILITCVTNRKMVPTPQGIQTTHAAPLVYVGPGTAPKNATAALDEARRTPAQCAMGEGGRGSGRNIFKLKKV